MVNSRKSHKLGVFTLAMINVAAVLSLRNLPGLSEYGYSLIFYLAMASLCFFIPSALVSAELASGWPKGGGVYLWVKVAFGPKWGFVAIFMQWVENLPWFPAVLAFVASSLAYIFSPQLAQNKWFVVAIIWVSIWGATLLNFHGMKLSAFLSTSGVICGTLIPGIVIIALGAVDVLSGRPLAITFSFESLMPELGNLNQLMLLAGMMASIVGMEMSAVHVTEVDNPTKTYPKAIFIACIIVILLNVLGALAIALVIPANDVSLSAGVLQALEEFLKLHSLHWATPVIAFLLAYGAFTMVVTWMVGPAKGILEVAKEGYLPSFWQRKNEAGMPTCVLVVQAICSTLLSVVVLFMPNVSSAFWIMGALAAQLYLVMYFFMFAAAIKLRYSHPEVERSYRIPGGKVGMWIVSGVALLTSLFGIICGFIPTDAVRKEGIVSMVGYVSCLLIGVIVFVSVPLFFYRNAEKKKALSQNKDGTTRSISGKR